MIRLNIAKIKQLIHHKGLSFAKLADLLDVNRSSISYWIMGKQFPNDENLSRLAHALDTEAEDLIIGVDDFDDNRTQPSALKTSSNLPIVLNVFFLTSHSDDTDTIATVKKIVQEVIYTIRDTHS